MASGLQAIVSVIIATLCLVSIAIFFAITFKRKLLQTLILSIGSIVTILFCFGLLNFRGCLTIGYVFIICLSITAGIYSAKRINGNRQLLKKRGIVSGILVVFLFMILSILWHYGRLFTPGDEFTHWGVIIKHMHMMDAFGTIPGSTILLKSYPPGASLFQYFFVASSPMFVEWTAYVAINMVFMAIIAHLASGLSKVRKVALVSAFIIVPLLFTYSFDYIFINALSVDVVLGMLFAFCVIAIVDGSKKASVYDTLVIATGCLLLTLTKDMGIVLAAIVLAVYAIDIIVIRRKEALTFVKHGLKKVRIQRAVILALPIIATLVPWVLWKMNTQINKVQPWFDTSSINIMNVVTDNLKPYQAETINSFIGRFLNAHISGLRISFSATMILFLIAMIAIAVAQKDSTRTKRLLCMGVVVFGGAIIYSAVLLTLYLFVFFPGEAVILASYSRYMGTYAMGTVLVLLTVLLYRETKLSLAFQVASGYIVTTTARVAEYIKKHIFIILLCVVCIIVLGKVAHIRSYFTQRVEPYFTVTYDRVNEAPVERWAHCLSNPKDSLDLISSKDNGSRINQLRYIFYGVSTDIPTGVTGPINALKTTPQYTDYWNQYVLKHYTLVYVDRYDDEFYKQHGKDFDNLRDNQLYRITKANDKTELKSVRSDNCTVVQQ